MPARREMRGENNMRRNLSARLLALFLAVALVVPMFPTVYAVEDGAAEPNVNVGTSEPTEETEAPAEETEAPAEETEAPAEETEAPTDETEAPAEETEAPAEETEDPSEETEAPAEETEEEPEEEPAGEIPFGFQGLPEGYKLSAVHSDKRGAMLDHDVITTVAGLTPGVDYVTDRIMVSASTKEEAELFAEAFNGELTRYEYKVALITLNDTTALEAIETSMDPQWNLPVASPNYLYQVNPIMGGALGMAVEIPKEQTWNTWIYENLDNPDPALLFPSMDQYQYQHDVVGSYAAWGISTGDRQVKVGVIDTGVAYDHPDLNVNVCDIGLGTYDAAGHGSHVSGIIAATLNNGLGGAGIAPNVSVTSYRVANDQGQLDNYGIFVAIMTAADNGEWIINMSLGGYFYDYYDDMAIQYAHDKGTTVVVAMGNDGSNTLCYPAAYNNVIAVGATTETDGRAYFSNFGPWCDVSAPGYEILSTYPGGFAYMSGTSMACPVVAGVCAAYMSVYGHVSPEHMEAVLEANCTPCPDAGMGAGVVNLANMLDYVPEKPVYTLESSDGTVYTNAEGGTKYTGTSLECETTLTLAPALNDQSNFILYTICDYRTGGPTPSVKEGQVVHGEVYEGPIDLSQYAGRDLTIRFMQVSGRGVPGPVETLKVVKVAESVKVTGVEVSGTVNVVAGTYNQYTASVLPASANQKVVWEIVDRTGTNMQRVTVSATGKLSSPKTANGTVTLRATSKADNKVYGEIVVNIMRINPVYSMRLSTERTNMWVGENIQLSIAKMVDKNGTPIDPNLSGVAWKTSNAKVATVDQNGFVTIVGKGSVSITCKSLDGSGVSARCVIYVKQQVESITISGRCAVAPGKSAGYSASVQPYAANNKTVRWTLDEPVEGVKINNSTGILTVAKTVPVGTEVVIRCDARDGMGTFDTFTVVIQPAVTKVLLDAAVDTDVDGVGPYVEYNDDGVLTSVNLFSVDLYETWDYETMAFLTPSFVGPESCKVEWTSSNTKVATVDADGVVTAHSNGTATITCKALDGSNKKATVTVKVTSPVSIVDIDTSALQLTNGNPYIAFGTSVENKVVFGDTYGVPSNTEINWQMDVFIVTMVNGGLALVADVTEDVVAEGLVTLHEDGAIDTDEGLMDYFIMAQQIGQQIGLPCELFLQLVAEPADGTAALDVYGLQSYFLLPPTTYITTDEPVIDDAWINYGWAVTFSSDQWNYFGNPGFFGFSATSSDPETVSFVEITVYQDEEGYIYFDENGGLVYQIVFVCSKVGTAEITIVSNDGSGAQLVLTINCTEEPAGASYDATAAIEAMIAAGRYVRGPKAA